MPRTIQIVFFLVAFALMNCMTASAQVNSQNGGMVNIPNKSVDNPIPDVYGGYQIGVGDVLDIHVSDEDDITGRYQVDQDGKVKVALLSQSIPAAGSTTFELADRLRDELKKEKILRDPSVTVLIIRGVTQNASVLGAVNRPGVYPIEKPSTLMDLISVAGGLAPNAGDSLTISHHSEAAGTMGPNATQKPIAVTISSVNITELLSGKDPALNVSVQAGDVINVGTAAVVFVVGSVGRPGAFAVQDRSSQMTVLQALAMAQGPTSTAALNRTIIIRKSANDADRQEIRLDLKKVMRGKEKDQVLEANDILFVPQSGFKASTQRLAQMGAQAAVTAAAYSVVLY